ACLEPSRIEPCLEVGKPALEVRDTRVAGIRTFARRRGVGQTVLFPEKLRPAFLSLTWAPRVPLHEVTLGERAQFVGDDVGGGERVEALAPCTKLSRRLWSAQHQDSEECQLRSRQLQRLVQQMAELRRPTAGA